MAADKPNILVLWGDDVGLWNSSAYNRGGMGYQTPNIDSIADEGALFTDMYAQQSCTAGRAAFILGEQPFRTGLLTIGMPGSDQGIPEWAPTIADLLKERGYKTGQFGKNHLGDQDEHLPTNHGFDEFFGNLYHLNAEEEPETYYYPKNPEFHEKFGPRGVIHSYADGKIEDTGPLTRKRMETVDYEFGGAAKAFMGRAVKADKPFFVWMNFTRMHVWTRMQEKYKGRTGIGIYADGMVELDDMVGRFLEELKELGEGKAEKGPRREIMYFAASGMLNAIRVDDWKLAFATERGAINTAYRETPAWPVLTNLRADPFESASRESGMYVRWYVDNMWMMVPAQGFVHQFFGTIDDYPFQSGGGLSAGNIGYSTLERQKALGGLRRLMDISIHN